MPTIGEFLKAHREARGLTLEQAAHVTRVRIHYLRALEEDERENLPSAVQGRGYLRLYADYLGLSAELLLAAWESGQLPAETELDAAEPTTASVEAAVQASPSVAAEPLQPVVEPQQVIEEDVGAAVSIAEQQPPETESQVILNEIGQRLRLQRETLGISLADVERHLRVRQHYILALERGALDDLPSPVQGRGMLNNYARFLSLDADAILLRFADALQARREERMAEQTVVKARRPTTKPTQASNWRRLVTPDLLVGGGLFVLMFFFLVWGVSRIDSLNRPLTQITGTPLSISEVLLLTPTPSPSPMVLTPTPRQQVEPGQNNLGQPGGGEIVVTPINTDPLQVYVVAQQRAWVRVVVDGKPVFQGRVLPGNAYPFSGVKQIELITGNAAALRVVYNQQNLGVLGNVGQVVQLIFVPGSVITPTPLAPVVLPTQRPTLTLQPSPTQPMPTITPFIP
jgi:cytoskeletal protein RodZ